MSIRTPILVLLVALGAAGCSTYRHGVQVQDGPGLEFKAAEVQGFAENQEAVLKQLRVLAGAADPPAGLDWDRIIDAGMDFADSRCEAYLHALFRLDRDKKTVTAQLGLLGTATAGLMAAAESAARDVAAAAVLFGLTGSTVDNLASNLLYELDPSSVRTLVKSLQSGFRASRQPGYDSRPAAMRVIRAYAMLCVPANIEAEVNLAVKQAQPLASEGNPATGQPPEVSNAGNTISPVAAQIDDSTELLKKFVRPSGTSFDRDNLAKLEAFIRSKGLNVSVTAFMRQAQHAAARAEAVTALKLK